MLKTISIIVLILILTIMFIEPVRKYINNLFRDKDTLTEEKIIGLSIGYNPQVKKIQEILEKSGFEPGPIDGRVGHKTRGAIKEFQKAKGLKSTGKVDKETWSELNRQEIQVEFTTKTPDRAKQIQTALKKAGFYTGEIDGKLGPRTKKAIKAFQKSKGLTADGVVDAKTWKELNRYLKNGR